MENDFIWQIYTIVVIILSAVFHEYAHGFVADYLGDPTPRSMGRLTLNPLVHIDLWGSILMPFMLFILSNGSFVFAYAKPVPFNPFNLRDQKWGVLKVAVAGVFVNALLAISFGLILRFVIGLPFTVQKALVYIILMNLMLAVFNLIPVPPLDGSKVLFSLLSNRWYRLKVWMEQNYLWLLLAVLFLLSYTSFMSDAVHWLFNLIVGV